MNKKTLYIVGGVVLVGGIAYFMYTKKKKQQEASRIEQERLEQEAADELAAKMEAEAKAEQKEIERKEKEAKCMLMGELRTTEQNQWVGISNSDREKANQIKVGSKVSITNTNETLDGEYEVLDTWSDKKGNVGAIDINHKLEIPMAVKGKKGDESFSGKGLICMI